MSWDDPPYNEQPPPRDDTFAKVLRVLNHSFNIGTYLGVRVRVHISFLIFAGIMLISEGQPWWTLQWGSLLFLSVLLHEFGHVMGCRSVGGQANEILMWPLGGLAFCAPPRKPWPEFVTVVCGPLVNVLLAGIALLVLVVGWGTPLPVGFNPFKPFIAASDNSVQQLFALLFVVNYILLLFNLALVFYPFDGGRMLQIALWAKVGYRRSMKFATQFGMFGAVVVALIGITSQQLMLTVIAIFGFVTCYQQAAILRKMDEYGGNVIVQGGFEGMVPRCGDDDDDDFESKPGPIARWRARRAGKKADAQRAKEAAFETEVDRILVKVKDNGLQSLTDKEKKTLQRETDRKQVG